MEITNKTKKKKPRNPPVVVEYDRTAFELTVTKHATNVGKVIEKYQRGAITKEDYCILYNDAMEFFKELIYGWWDNASLRKNPKSKWSREQRAIMFTKYIEEAFTVRASSQPAAHDEKPPR